VQIRPAYTCDSTLKTNDPPSSLRSMGWDERWNALLKEVDTAEGSPPVPGRVIRRDRGVVLVGTEGSVVPAETAGHPEQVITGDWVALSGDRLLAVLPRRGALRRRGADDSEQLMAANVDVVLLVCGLDRPVKPGRIHRGAVQAWDAGAEPVVVLNKADLCEDPLARAEDVAGQTLGLDVLTVSARTGRGLDELRAAIGGRTAVLLGESGAGKSSLLNALAGRSLTPEGEVRAGDSKGRHTTTRRELYFLPGSGVVIDTPGIRSLGLVASAEAVETAFGDVETIAEDCRFSDCLHETEPDCAIQAAIDAGTLRPDRVQAYLELRKELQGQVLRANPHERRQHERKFARLVQEGKKAKQGRLKK